MALAALTLPENSQQYNCRSSAGKLISPLETNFLRTYCSPRQADCKGWLIDSYCIHGWFDMCPTNDQNVMKKIEENF